MKSDLLKEMGYLSKLLNTEWKRSGEPVQAVRMDCKQGEEVLSRLLEIIQEKKRRMQDDMTLRQSFDLSHDSYVLLRLSNKFTTAKSVAEITGNKLAVWLDREEYQAYQKIMQ